MLLYCLSWWTYIFELCAIPLQISVPKWFSPGWILLSRCICWQLQLFVLQFLDILIQLSSCNCVTGFIHLKFWTSMCVIMYISITFSVFVAFCNFTCTKLWKFYKFSVTYLPSLRMQCFWLPIIMKIYDQAHIYLFWYCKEIRDRLKIWCQRIDCCLPNIYTRARCVPDKSIPILSRLPVVFIWHTIWWEASVKQSISEE